MSLFADFFDKQHQQHRHKHTSQQAHAFGRQRNYDDPGHEHHGEHESHYSHNRHREAFSHVGPLLQRLVRNKTLLILVGLVLLVALGLAVAALVFLLPLIPKLLGYLDINGLKSVLDQVVAVSEKVLAVGGK